MQAASMSANISEMLRDLSSAILTQVYHRKLDAEYGYHTNHDGKRRFRLYRLFQQSTNRNESLPFFYL